MAVEWALGAGIAVGKVVLRLYGDPDVADMVDDAVGGVTSVRAKPKRKDLGQVLAARIEADVQPRLMAQLTNQEASAAAQIAADVVAGLADKPAALSTALARPGEFLGWVRAHGGVRARQDLVAPHAEDLYDAVLASAAQQLVVLAPTSQRAISAGMGRSAAAAGCSDQPAQETDCTFFHTLRCVGDPDRDRRVSVARQHLVPAGRRHPQPQIRHRRCEHVRRDLGLAEPARAGQDHRSRGGETGGDIPLLTAPPEGRSWLIVLDDLTDPADLSATDTQAGCWPPVTHQGLTVTTTLSRAAVARVVADQPYPTARAACHPNPSSD